jgi:UDP-N-acetylmuramoyl-L-alanyl-D-glutamate--2,6-diaminopimelate ligase
MTNERDAGRESRRDAAPVPQRLDALLNAAATARGGEPTARFEAIRGPGEVVVRRVAIDSRAVGGGDLFVAVPGTSADGRRFLEAALAAGAEAAVVGVAEGERLDDLPGVAAWRAAGRPLIVTTTPRLAATRLAFAAQAHPDRALTLVGITGTNGKSTVATLIRQIAQGAGRRAAELGTLGWRLGDAPLSPLGNTTPGPVELAALFRRLVDDGADLLAMEVSSHAVDQERVGGLAFDVCVFTNLTPDHLDYHGTMEEYGAVKRRWFAECRAADAATAIVANVDDPVGRAIAADHAEPRDRLWTFGADRRHAPRLLARSIEAIPGGTRALMKLGAMPRGLEWPLRGRFNVSNVLAAAGAAMAAGVAEGEVCRELTFLKPPSGRFEPIDAGQPFTVLVDYAHTPDALERLLEATRELRAGFARRAEAAEQGAARSGISTSSGRGAGRAGSTVDHVNDQADDASGGARAGGRVVIVFGCGGDRDREKRPLMGAIAARLADLAIITTDNPRGEAPAAIIAAIRAGADSVVNSDGHDGHDTVAIVNEIADRREAIAAAIADARPGDFIVIAGKGHEAYQEIAGTRHPFCDQDEARAAIVRWFSARAAGLP